MKACVLDASALLAWALREPGWMTVDEVLAAGQVECVLSAVNLCETVSKLIDRGLPESAVEPFVAALPAQVVPFDRALALAAARLRPATRRYGLALGDRACLALAAARRAPVLTADRVWSELDLDVEVRIVRPG